MDRRYFEKLCEAVQTLCEFCEADECEECEKCTVNNLIDDAYNELPDKDKRLIHKSCNVVAFWRQ